MAMELNQPLKETSKYREYFLAGRGGQCLGWQPYHIHEPTVLKSDSLNFLEPSEPEQVCMGIVLLCL
jgi:hypothetical protein